MGGPGFDERKKERKGTPVGVVKEGPASCTQRPLLIATVENMHP
jgi:hypothetical protein